MIGLDHDPRGGRASVAEYHLRYGNHDLHRRSVVIEESTPRSARIFCAMLPIDTGVVAALCARPPAIACAVRTSRAARDVRWQKNSFRREPVAASGFDPG